MYFKNYNWEISKLIKLEDEIDKRPQFQRGDVWGPVQQKLFIDSIFRGFDIPKIYLNSIHGPHKYEVTDGQQRLTAIWKFYRDGLTLPKQEGELFYASDKKFSELKPHHQNKFLNFEITTAVSYQATDDDIRELFIRLQKGIKLTPPELRNSMPGALAGTIRAMATSHGFFAKSVFKPGRYATDDLLAHAFALAIYGPGNVDMKAPVFSKMYQDYQSSIDTQLVKSINETLTQMEKVIERDKKLIAFKWVFTDVFAVLHDNKPIQTKFDILSDRLKNFETRRREFTKDPSVLIANGSKDRNLYDYLIAFKTSGGEKKNVSRRVEILEEELLC